MLRLYSNIMSLLLVKVLSGKLAIFCASRGFLCETIPFFLSSRVQAEQSYMFILIMTHVIARQCQWQCCQSKIAHRFHVKLPGGQDMVASLGRGKKLAGKRCTNHMCRFDIRSQVCIKCHYVIMTERKRHNKMTHKFCLQNLD